MARGKRQRQQCFEFRTWGGARDGAGRKPNGGKAGAPHTRRADVDRRHPLHVTLRIVRGLPGLRRRHVWQIVMYALAVTLRRDDFAICHVSIQGDHIHLIVEAADRRALSRGMRGLQISFARQLNHRLGRRGRVFADRFHTRALRTPTETRNAIRYVLSNARRHGARFAGLFDPCSTANQFAGWVERPDALVRGPFLPVRRARTWLLDKGWRRLGLISALETPGPLG